jgi:hypothetical protein
MTTRDGTVGDDGVSMGRQLLQLLLPCVLVVAAWCGGVWLWRAELRATATTGIDIDDRLVEGLARWRPAAAPTKQFTAVVVGDSLTVVGAWGNIGGMVMHALQSHQRPAEVWNLTHPGLRPINYYALLDDVSAKGPNAVIIEVNIIRFMDIPTTGVPRFAPLLRRLSFTRALRVRRALAADDLDLLDPWLYRWEEALDVLWVTDGLRIVAGDQLDRFGDGVQQALGVRQAQGLERFAARLTEAFPLRTRAYGADYAEHPDTEVLQAFLQGLHERGIAARFYVSPIHPAYGVRAPATAATLPARLDALRRRIGATEAEWIDLHALLPATDFRDESNHLTPDGAGKVANAIAARL